MPVTGDLFRFVINLLVSGAENVATLFGSKPDDKFTNDRRTDAVWLQQRPALPVDGTG